MSKNTGADDVDITLHWNDAAASGIQTPDSLLVVGLTDNGVTNTWESYGNGGTTGGTGNGVSGSVTSDYSEPPPLDEVTKLTIGSTNAGANALPVTLLSFSASVQRETIVLEWATITEENASYFAVEHSIDGKTFHIIGYVNAYGFSNSLQHYDYIDSLPRSGVNYYRLRQVDYDGNYYYSPIVSVRIKQNVSKIKAIPNLVIEEFRLNGFDREQTSLLLEVYDLSGTCHYRGYHKVINGEISLKVSHLKLGFGGMYHILARDGREVKSTKIIILE